jgi:hypothetical protein
MAKIVQPQNLYIAPNVDAQTESKLRLPGGQDESFWYSLGAQSTVPFVEFIGGGVVQKAFTWGEMVEVPAGQEVLVKNASLMRGDIFIQSGRDFVARPRRITVPVTMLDSGGGLGPWTDFGVLFAVTTEFPCDARNAHEAYLDIQLIGGDLDNAYIGILVQHTIFNHTYTAQIITPVTPLIAVTKIVPPNTVTWRIPLGISKSISSGSGQPDSMLDKIEVLIQNNPVANAVGVVGATGFWVLNY